MVFIFLSNNRVVAYITRAAMARKRTRVHPRRRGEETLHNLTRAPLISWGCTKHKSKVDEDEEVEANDSKPAVL